MNTNNVISVYKISVQRRFKSSVVMNAGNGLRRENDNTVRLVELQRFGNC